MITQTASQQAVSGGLSAAPSPQVPAAEIEAQVNVWPCSGEPNPKSQELLLHFLAQNWSSSGLRPTSSWPALIARVCLTVAKLLNIPPEKSPTQLPCSPETRWHGKASVPGHSCRISVRGRQKLLPTPTAVSKAADVQSCAHFLQEVAAVCPLPAQLLSFLLKISAWEGVTGMSRTMMEQEGMSSSSWP